MTTELDGTVVTTETLAPDIVSQIASSAKGYFHSGQLHLFALVDVDTTADIPGEGAVGKEPG